MAYVRCNGLVLFGTVLESCEHSATFRVIDQEGVERWFCPHHYAHFVTATVPHEVWGAHATESEKIDERSAEKRTRKQPDAK